MSAHELRYSGTLPPRRPPLRYAGKDSSDTLTTSPNHSYMSSRRNALNSPPTPGGLMPLEQGTDPLLDGITQPRRRGSAPAPEHERAAHASRGLRPLQLAPTLGPLPPTPAIPTALQMTSPMGSPAQPRTNVAMTEEARAALALVTGRQASRLHAAHILSIPALGLAGKIIIALGLKGVVVAHAMHDDNSDDALKWWGTMGVGAAALVYSIFAGSFHVNHFSPTAAWALGAASVVSALVFSVGEWMAVQGAITKNNPLYNGGAAVTGMGLSAASLVNFLYFTHGELRHGFVPLPRRVLTSSILGALVGVTSWDYTLTSVTRHDGVAARDTVSSVLLLGLLLSLMFNFSYGMRGFLGLSHNFDLESQRALPPTPGPSILQPSRADLGPQARSRTTLPSPPSYFSATPNVR